MIDRDRPESGPREAALVAWQRLLAPDHADLVAAAASIDTLDAASIERLRERWGRDLVEPALQLAEARRRAAAKFPDAARLVADVAGVEQATSHLVAEHKAKRYAAVAPGRIVDLCCGIGGDAMSLFRVAPVEAYDISPLRAWMCEVNAGCRATATDVTTLDLQGEVVHLDPARRREAGPRRGRRAWRLEDYEPGPSFMAELRERCPDAAIKLGPGVDPAALPDPDATELEFITERGTLVQAVLWSGRLAPHAGTRTATLLPEGESLRGAPGDPPLADEGAIGRCLLVPDPAAERTGLLGLLCERVGAAEIHPGLGLLTSDEAVTSPWCRAFEVLEVMPLRPRRVRAWLAARGAGVVEVKTRGRAVDPDALQRTLRGEGDERFTVFALRIGKRMTAVMTRRGGFAVGS